LQLVGSFLFKFFLQSSNNRFGFTFLVVSSRPGLVLLSKAHVLATLLVVLSCCLKPVFPPFASVSEPNLSYFLIFQPIIINIIYYLKPIFLLFNLSISIISAFPPQLNSSTFRYYSSPIPSELQIVISHLSTSTRFISVSHHLAL
jgi:hypothetical protein